MTKPPPHAAIDGHEGDAGGALCKWCAWSFGYNLSLMARSADLSALTGLSTRFGTFVAERFPLALAPARVALETVTQTVARGTDPASIETLRPAFRRELARRLYDAITSPDRLDETTPGTSAVKRLEQARAEIVDACDGFLRREAIRASLTAEERREILRGMVLTRAVDNRLKQFFMGGDVRWGDMAFQGKGFRSLGQEAIYAAGIRLRRGRGVPQRRHLDRRRRGAGHSRSRRRARDAARRGSGAHGAERADGQSRSADERQGPARWRLELGVLPASAPLSIGTMSIAGMAMAFWREGSGRVALSFIGEGGSSLGEWHEAINLCAARRCRRSSASRTIRRRCRRRSARPQRYVSLRIRPLATACPGITLDGTDPDAIAAAFAWAIERARAGVGPDAHRARCRCACAVTRITTTCSISARIRSRPGTTRRSGDGLRQP